MRTFQFLTLAALAGLLVVAACTQQNDPQPAPQQDYVAQLRAKIESGELMQGYRQKASVSPYNTKNPYDSAGIDHNLGVMYLLDSGDATKSLATAYQYLTGYILLTDGKDERDSLHFDLFNDAQQFVIDNYLDGVGNNNTAIFDSMKNRTTEYINILKVFYSSLDTISEGVDQVTFTKAVEDDLINNNTTLSSNEMQSLLEGFSIHRHSSYLWFIDKPVPPSQHQVSSPPTVDSQFFFSVVEYYESEYITLPIVHQNYPAQRELAHQIAKRDALWASWYMSNH